MTCAFVNPVEPVTSRTGQVLEITCAAREDEMDDDVGPLLTLADTAEPGQIIEFAQEGDTAYFGRGPEGVDLVIRGGGSRNSLSRVAGKVWRQWHQMWIANLSANHDLLLWEPSMPPEPPLPPRRTGTPLHARTVPGHRCFVSSPTGGWALVVDQRRATTGDSIPGAQDARAEAINGSAVSGDVDRGAHALINGEGFGLGAGGRVDDGQEVTVSAPAVPADLVDVAAALCEPLLTRRARLPATYARIAARLDISPKAARLRVERLVELYEDHSPVLGRRREDRDRRLAGPELVRGAGGVWRAAPIVPVSREGSASLEPLGRPGDQLRPVTHRDGRPGDTVGVRQRGPELPYSYDVAHLLVRRRLVTPTNVTRLDS